MASRSTRRSSPSCVSAGIAGATVLRGIEGFGANAHLHTTRILRLSEDLPILIEVVDQEDRVRAILPDLDEMVGDGLITLEKVEVLAYRGSGPSGSRQASRGCGTGRSLTRTKPRVIRHRPASTSWVRPADTRARPKSE